MLVLDFVLDFELVLVLDFVLDVELVPVFEPVEHRHRHEHHIQNEKKHEHHVQNEKKHEHMHGRVRRLTWRPGRSPAKAR